jgi:hypothetical protein
MGLTGTRISDLHPAVTGARHADMPASRTYGGADALDEGSLYGIGPEAVAYSLMEDLAMGMAEGRTKRGGLLLLVGEPEQLRCFLKFNGRLRQQYLMHAGECLYKPAAMQILTEAAQTDGAVAFNQYGDLLTTESLVNGVDLNRIEEDTLRQYERLKGDKAHTRHLAGLYASTFGNESYPMTSIVLSEETGRIMVAQNGRIITFAELLQSGRSCV